MGNSGGTWQKRKADSLEERFGLLDNPSSLKYRRQPVYQEPVGVLPKAHRGLTALGVTSGIGSMLVGARDMGFQVVGNVEWRDYYRFRSSDNQSTFLENFPGAFMSRGSEDVASAMLDKSFDFVAGHPECGRYSQLSFSVAGGNYQETRGTDVSDIPLFLKYMAQLKPRFFLMDDLPGSFEAFPMSEYVDLLPDYDLFPEWISNWGYGNIQKHRNRMFIVGALKSERFAFVPGEEEHTDVLSTVIGDLVTIEPEELPNHANVDPDYTPGRYVNMSFYGHRPTWDQIRGSNYDLTKNIPYCTPEEVEKIRPGTLSPKWDGFCSVLSGGFNPIHPLRRLPLSVRERARIQGFGDDFTFYHDDVGPYRPVWEPYNSDGQRGIKQTGKAMPVQFCAYVAAQVKAHILGEPFKASGKRLLKPNPLVDQAKRDFCQLSGYANPKAVREACWLGEDLDFYRPVSKKRRPLKDALL